MTDKTKTKTCPRCGLKFSGKINIIHTIACDKLPPPAELATIFINNSSLTLSDLSNKYDTSWRFIRTRLNYGAKLIYGADGKERIDNEVRVRGAERASEAARGSRKSWSGPAKRNKCKNCKILLDHPKVTAVGNLCSVCAGEEPKHYLLAV